MKPKFKTRIAWEKAQILMQPSLIRILDNIRKQLDTSSWQGSYQEINHPIPGYILCLTNGKNQKEIDSIILLLNDK